MFSLLTILNWYIYDTIPALPATVSFPTALNKYTQHSRISFSNCAKFQEQGRIRLWLPLQIKPESAKTYSFLFASSSRYTWSSEYNKNGKICCLVSSKLCIYIDTKDWRENKSVPEENIEQMLRLEYVLCRYPFSTFLQLCLLRCISINTIMDNHSAINIPVIINLPEL